MDNPKQQANLSPYDVDSINSPGFNWDKYQDAIDELPDSLYELLVDEQTSGFIKSLMQKYVQLSAQGPDIARLIRDVVIGTIFIGDMPMAIKTRLGIVDPETANNIYSDIYLQLFSPVMEDIKKVQTQSFPDKPFPSQPQPRKAMEAPQPTPQQPPRPMPTQNTPRPAQRRYPDMDLPETGGNIIDLRNMKNNK